MNVPSIIAALLVGAVCIAIIARAVYNKRHHKSSCGCGCENCAGKSSCHPE